MSWGETLSYKCLFVSELPSSLTHSHIPSSPNRWIFWACVGDPTTVVKRKKRNRMSELCNAFTYWLQPNEPKVFIHTVSATYTYRRIPFFTTRMLINTSDSTVNNQTVKLSVIVLGLLCRWLLPHFSPLYFLWRQNRPISMAFWKYVSARLFVVGFCVLLFLYCVRKERRKEKER